MRLPAEYSTAKTACNILGQNRMLEPKLFGFLSKTFFQVPKIALTGIPCTYLHHWRECTFTKQACLFVSNTIYSVHFLTHFYPGNDVNYGCPNLPLTMQGMVIRVVEFSSGGTKL